MAKLVSEEQVKELTDVMIEAVDELGRKISITQGGIQGAVTPTSIAPTAKGMYPVAEPGVYTNFKDSNNQPISITQEDFESGIVFIVFSGTSSAKVITPVPANGEVKEGDKRAVSGEEVLKHFDENTLPLDISYNLINKKNIRFGSFDVNGKFININTGLAYSNAIVDSMKFYAFVGGNQVNSPARFVWKDLFDNILKIEIGSFYQGFPIRVQSPINARKLDITLAYIGTQSPITDPTDNNIANSVMLVELDAVDAKIPPYVSFDYRFLSVEYVSGIEEVIESDITTNPTIVNMKESIDFLFSNYSEAYEFNGIDGSKNFTETYVLSMIGDYVEFTVKTEINGYSGLNLAGTKNTVRSLIGFNNDKIFWLRDIDYDSATLVWNIDQEIYNYRKFKITINQDGLWELFIDDISQGTNPYTAPLHINNVGKAYTSYYFKGRIKDFSIKAQGVDSLDIDLASESVYKVFEPIDQDAFEISPEVFYKYNPTGFKGKETLSIYVKQGNSTNVYSRFVYNRNYDMSDLIYLDYYRIEGAYRSIYNGQSMVDTTTSVLISAESEFTMLQRGKVDHVGSYHGDELFTSRRFLVDGKEFENYDSEIGLTACSKFEVEIHSTMHDVAASTEPDIPIPGHPVIAKHLKRTTFIDFGYECENVIEFVTSQQMVRAYTGLICISKNYATIVRDEYGSYGVADKGDNSRNISSNYAHTLFGSGEFGSSVINSEVVAIHKPNDKYCQALYKEFSKQWVQDRANDSKYYRILGYDSGGSVITTDVGEIWHLKSKLQVHSN